MNTLDPNIEITQKLIIKDFQMEDPGLVLSNLEKLRDWLTREISILMDRDFQQLLNILYRIDVREEKVKQAFASQNPAYEIAGLIIGRELEKVKTREKYK